METTTIDIVQLFETRWQAIKKNFPDVSHNQCCYMAKSQIENTYQLNPVQQQALNDAYRKVRMQ